MTSVDRRAARPGRTIHSLDERGFIRDWLVSPGWGTPCDDLSQVLESTGGPWGSDGRWVLTNGPDVAPLKEKLYRRHPLLLTQPLPDIVEGGAVEWVRSAGDVAGSAVWERVHTGSDGLVDWSRFCYTPEYRYAVAAAAVEVDQAEYRTLHVASTGPVAVFVGGELVVEADSFGYMEPNLHMAHVRLNSGLTQIHVVTWQVAFRECRHVFSLRVQGPPVRVVIPSPGVDEQRSRSAEQLLDSIAVGPWAARDGSVHIDGPDGLALAVTVGNQAPRSVRLTDGSAVIGLAATDGRTERKPPADGAAAILETGELELTIRVDDPHLPVYRAFRVAALPKRRRHEPVGAPDDWRAELLAHSAGHGPGTARTLARHALNPQSEVERADLTTALQMIHGRYDCADFEAVGLVTAWHRIPEPNWKAGDRDRVKDALTGFKYWIDQPGLDAMCYFTENHQMVWHTAEMLVGELFADEAFTNTGWTGAQHADHAQPMVLEWIHRKLVGGFSEFDSNAYLAIDCLALVSLVEFAQSTQVRQAAEALLDKTLLTLATNSWRGVHGAAHGRSYTHTLRSGRFEETAPIMWLLFGVGALNAATLPATALATAEHYQVPPVVRALAATCPSSGTAARSTKASTASSTTCSLGRTDRTCGSGGPRTRCSPASRTTAPACQGCRSTSGAPRSTPRSRCSRPTPPPPASAPRLDRTRGRDNGCCLGCTKTATPCSCCIASPPETGWEPHTCGSRPSCSMSGGPTARGSLVGTATATSRSPPELGSGRSAPETTRCSAGGRSAPDVSMSRPLGAQRPAARSTTSCRR